MTDLAIDPAAARPPFEQLKAQLIDQIMRRRLPEGTKLPSVRALAAQLDLAAGTVARTYREMEEEGYLVMRGRLGTFVAAVAPPSESALERARELAADYVAAARDLGLGDQAIAGLIDRTLLGESR